MWFTVRLYRPCPLYSSAARSRPACPFVRFIVRSVLHLCGQRGCLLPCCGCAVYTRNRRTPLIVTDAPALAASIMPSPTMYAMTIAPAMMSAVICVACASVPSRMTNKRASADGRCHDLRGLLPTYTIPGPGCPGKHRITVPGVHP